MLVYISKLYENINFNKNRLGNSITEQFLVFKLWLALEFFETLEKEVVLFDVYVVTLATKFLVSIVE